MVTAVFDREICEEHFIFTYAKKTLKVEGLFKASQYVSIHPVTQPLLYSNITHKRGITVQRLTLLHHAGAL